MVKRLTAALPRDHVLVVRPHDAEVGELLSRAAAVIVSEASAGVRALAHGRPVLALGTRFAAGSGTVLEAGATPSAAVAALPDLLAFRSDRERTLRFLHAVLCRTEEGHFPRADDSPSNARAVAVALSRALSAPARPPPA